MKTIQELYNEIMASKELKEQAIEAAKAGKQEEFLKEHGCEATLEDVKAFLEAKQQEDAPLSFDELENAAGGECNEKTSKEARFSAFTLGFGCLGKAIRSAMEENKHVGQRNDEEGRLCNDD